MEKIYEEEIEQLKQTNKVYVINDWKIAYEEKNIKNNFEIKNKMESIVDYAIIQKKYYIINTIKKPRN